MTGGTRWLDREGRPIACREKLAVLEENATELRQTMQDMFEDAVLMGVDEGSMRQWLTDLVAALTSPRQAR